MVPGPAVQCVRGRFVCLARAMCVGCVRLFFSFSPSIGEEGAYEGFVWVCACVGEREGRNVIVTAVLLKEVERFWLFYKNPEFQLPMSMSLVISKLSQLLAMLGATLSRFGTMPLYNPLKPSCLMIVMMASPMPEYW